MTDVAPSAEKRMRLRYAGSCRLCGLELPAKADAIYERSTKTVRCVECVAVEHVAIEQVAPESVAAESLSPGREEPTDSGVPGASARREFERRQGRREAKVRAAHPKVGGLILALTDDPQSTTAWDTGATGEERLGARLNEFASGTLRVLHDRAIPGSRANIDHLAVSRSGIYVIDAKKYAGRPTLQVEGGLLRPRVEKLLVGRRDRTKLVDGMLAQVEVVRDVVGPDVPIHPVLCFIEADWPLLGGAFDTRGVLVCKPKKLYPKLKAEGAFDVDAIAGLHRTLADRLRSA